MPSPRTGHTFRCLRPSVVQGKSGNNCKAEAHVVAGDKVYGVVDVILGGHRTVVGVLAERRFQASQLSLAPVRVPTQLQVLYTLFGVLTPTGGECQPPYLSLVDFLV